MENDPRPKHSVLLQGFSQGGLIGEASLAEAMADLLIGDRYGADEVTRQKPFVAMDEGDRWRVLGSMNKDRTQEGPGPAVVVIWKKDGRILEMIVTKISLISRKIRDAMSDEDKAAREKRDKDFFGS